ncbi:MAG TPA: IS110 family transposase [Terriglobales bacterium]|nr:IS110 family transposase [Terriglobales bacterium]
MQVTTIGLDLAKHVFQIHGVDASGQVSVRRALRRKEVLSFFGKLAPCLVGIEACATAHYWAREIGTLGHEVRLMPPAYVKAYVKRNKNDMADAEAICEAVTRPTMRFVAVKSVEQQSVLMLHRTPALLVRQRTMLANAVRAHLAEFGIVAGLGVQNVIAMVRKLMVEQADNEFIPPRDPLPALVRIALAPLLTAMLDLNGRIQMIGTEIIKWHRANEMSRRLETIPGFGAITASAVAATVTDPSVFESGREFAWLGLTPRQNSSGGKERLGGITKMGDGYIRTLPVVGATAVIRYAKRDGSAKSAWIRKLLERKPARVVAVALANKMARIAWALMTKKENYRAVPA